MKQVYENCSFGCVVQAAMDSAPSRSCSAAVSIDVVGETLSTLELLTKEVAALREENAQLRAQLRSDADVEYKKSLSLLDSRSPRRLSWDEDGGSCDREVLRQKSADLEASLKAALRAQTKAKADRQKLARELEETLLARAKDLDKIAVLEATVTLAQQEVDDAKAMSAKWQAECASVRREAEVSVSEVRALAQDSIDGLAMSLKRALETQEALRIQNEAFRAKDEEFVRGSPA